MAGQSGIEVEQVTKVYRRGKPPALIDFDLRVEPGEILGLVGPNGAGKTTLLGCLLGLLRPTSGSIRIDGMRPDSLALRAATGYLPERLQFHRSMTGRQFLALHHGLARRPAETRSVEVAAVLSRVKLEQNAWDVALKTYSRGMLQRLGLAQALIGEPRFLFLDEPTSGVDPPGVMTFQEILVDLKARGVTVVVSSHQLDQLERTCDRVVLIQAGQAQAIEDLRRGADGPSVVLVRWMGAAPSPQALSSLAAETGTSLVDHAPDRARFAVVDEVQTARLIRGLVERAVAVVEVTPEGGRLEKFFRPGAQA